MPTAFTEDGYRFKIYPNDHTPAHVHVQKGEREARITLTAIDVVSNECFNERDLNRIKKMVKEHQA
mgnify:CR=1 FL=1